MTEDDSSTACSQCALLDRKILHNIRLNSTFHRLCTTCVLRLHPKSFCPSCLAVYHRSPPDHAAVCHKCNSSSHRTCLSPSVTGRTPCAACVNPNVLVFNLNPRTSDRRIDLSAAKLLVAAAEISWLSMSKAEAAAVMEADWRAKEASEWRRKAKDAINHVVKVKEMEKKKKKKKGDNNGNGNSSIGSIEVTQALSSVKLGGKLRLI